MTKFIIIGDNAREEASLALQLWDAGDEVVDSFGEAEEWILMPNRADADEWRADAAADGIILAEAHKEPFAGTTLWRLHYPGPDAELVEAREERFDVKNTEGLYVANPSSMRTWTGRRLDVLNVTPDDVNIFDIAHALARQCRYNGHVENFVSVARHSVWVSHRLRKESFELQMWGLLHDASEAYIGDMIKPLKHSAEMNAFVAVEYQVEQAIATAFGLPFPMPVEVKDADRFVSIEVEIGMGLRETHSSTYEEDERLFLDRYYDLFEDRELWDD